MALNHEDAFTEHKYRFMEGLKSHLGRPTKAPRIYFFAVQANVATLTY